jgi:hypothetical protein
MTTSSCSIQVEQRQYSNRHASGSTAAKIEKYTFSKSEIKVMSSKKVLMFAIWVFGVVFAASICIGLSSEIAMAGQKGHCKNDRKFTTEFYLQDCTFANDDSEGANRYFSLQPGHELVLEGEEDGEEIHVWINVTEETENIEVPDIGLVSTRVVEEWEWVDGVLVEVSRNFFARCKETNDIYYFGEDVDICEAGLESDNGGFLCGGGRAGSSRGMARGKKWRNARLDYAGNLPAGVKVFPGDSMG